jgi:predicted DNA-binding transcriptional regulator AlpA
LQEQAERLGLRLPVPGVVGATEAAQVLGLSRSRMYQLRVTDPDFPRPVQVNAAGALWRVDDLEVYAANRKPPGRPAITQARRRRLYTYAAPEDVQHRAPGPPLSEREVSTLQAEIDALAGPMSLVALAYLADLPVVLVPTR